MSELVIDDLIGVRFKNHGRSIQEGFDCYGLSIEIAKRLGHTLIDFEYLKACPETFFENVDDIREQLDGLIEETDEQKLGNLILFADEKGRMVHMGTILQEGLFIHADIPCVMVTRLERYHRKQWKVYKWLQ